MVRTLVDLEVMVVVLVEHSQGVIQFFLPGLRKVSAKTWRGVTVPGLYCGIYVNRSLSIQKEAFASTAGQLRPSF